MSIKIEKGIPITRASDKLRGEIPIAVRSMDVGDSFEVEKKSRVYLHTLAQRFGIKITTRVQQNGKYRVWRTA